MSLVGQNYGVDYIWPDLTEDDIKNLQRIDENGEGISRTNKGWNEFVLYGKDINLWNMDLETKYYYMYTGMTWQNAGDNLPVEEAGTGYGLFLQNYINGDYDGWMCNIAPTS